MIDTIISSLPYAAWCFGGAIAGFGTCAVLTMGKVADGDAKDRSIARYFHEAADAQDAHTRCSDALETARNRIERALSVETPKAAHGVKKMARLLRGDEA